MSEFKRRDITNYFNDRHVTNQKSEYDFNVLSNEIKSSMIEYLSNTKDISYNNVKNEIIKQCTSIFGLTHENILFRNNFYDSIDLIFKIFLELYENVVVSDNANDFYQKNVLVNKGKFSKIFIDYNDYDFEDSVINSAKSKNAKILILSTKGVGKQIDYDHLSKICSSLSCLILVDDFENKIQNNVLLEIISKYENIVFLKGINNSDKVDLITSFIISNKENISLLNNFTNYLDIDLFSLINIMININGEKKDIEIKVEKEVEKEVKQEQINDEVAKIVAEQTKEKNIVENNKNINNTDILLSSDDTYITPAIDDNFKNIIENYESSLIAGSRFSLIGEVTKFNFISIFSSNSTHVYILSRTPIFSNLTENGIVLKKYNSSNGEIIRLIVDNFSQNKKILNILFEISQKRKGLAIF